MKKKYRKIIAALMCTVYICATYIYTAGAASIGNIVHQSTLQIAGNAGYTKIIAMHDSYGRQEANVFIVDPTQPGIEPVAMYGSKLYGRSTITTAVDYATTTEGLSIAGGMNGDFYSFMTGISLGMVVHNGRLNTSDAGYPAIGFKDDGDIIIDYPSISISMVSSDGISIPVDHFNKYRTMYGVYLFSEDFSSESRTQELGTHIVLEIESGEIGIGKTVNVKVTDIMTNAGNIKMLDNCLLLSVDNNGPLDKISQIALGQSYSITFNASSSEWNDVEEAIGGGQILVKDGIVQPDSTTEIAPRTAVGVTAAGELVMAQIDGRQSGHSKGATITQTAEFMASLGCVTALNLDGGGSSTTYLRSTGYATGEVINEVSDGTPRKNANYLLLVNTLEPDGMAYRLQIYPYNIEALPNATVTLDIKAADVSYHATAAPEPESVIFSVSNGLGTVTADVSAAYLTTGSQTGSGIISAQWGAASGYTELNILDSIDSIYVYKNDSSSEVSSLDLAKNEEISLTAESYKNGLEVYSSNRSFTWTVSSPDLGTITENGVFKASNKSNQSGTITVSYGNTSKVINVTVGKGADDTPPEVAIDSMDGWDWRNEFLNIGAVVTDDGTINTSNIVLEIDGNAVNFDYYPESGILMSHLTNTFDAGIHKVSITAVDSYGNRTTKYATFTVNPEGKDTAFSDTKNHWATEYIDFLYNTGLTKGTIDETTGKVYYKPDNNITRAEFAVMLARYLNLDISYESTGSVSFTDTAQIPEWAKKEIYAVAEYGAMTGKPDGAGGLSFDPNANLTRAEIITAIGRLMDDGYKSAPITFTDAADIGSWAVPYVGKLITLGVISGYTDGTLMPQNYVTRAEVAKILFAIY